MEGSIVNNNCIGQCKDGRVLGHKMGFNRGVCGYIGGV